MTTYVPEAPRGHRDPAVIAAKRARVNEPHVRPLNDMVREINRIRGAETTPWFDPDGGGVGARALFLLECPGRMATAGRGSGFISADNDDQTAANFFTLRHEAGLPRDRLVAWNVVPWYLPAGNRTANATAADVREAAPWLARLIDLLPSLELVVLMGKRAQQGWDTYEGSHRLPRSLDVLATPHPSPLALNGRPHRRDEIRDAMRRAATLT